MRALRSRSWLADVATARSSSITLPLRPSSVSAARRFLSRRFAEYTVDLAVVNNAILVVSELVTNAVLHALGPVVVEAAFADGSTAKAPTLRIVVSDASPIVPMMRAYSEGASTGRGLALVAALARRWGVEAEGSGKAVWVELDATSANGTVTPPETSSEPPIASDETGRVVRFLGVPVDSYLCLQEQNDAILRELELVAYSPAPDRIEPSRELTEVVDRARQFFRTNPEGMRREVLAAAARGQRLVDLARVITVSMLAPAEELVSLFEDAERLGERGELLLGPSDLEVVHLRRWFAAELHRQVVDGVAPATYAPLEP